MPDCAKPPLVINDLSFRFPSLTGQGEVPVFDGLSLVLPRERVTVVLGAADAGKTTLARILVGSAPRFTGGVLTGSVRLEDREVPEAKPFELMETIGCVSQDSDEQILTTRCDTEVAFALESLGMHRDEMIDRVAESLRLVGLDGFQERNPSTLSGGEKKRLIVACLAAVGPPVWVLDESLLELDQHWRRRIIEILQTAHRTVLVLDSRISPLLEEKSDRFAILSGGRLCRQPSRPDEAAFISCARNEGILPDDGIRDRQDRPWTRLLRAEGVSFKFPGHSGFSLEVESLELSKGVVCSLLGDNGCGKSTLGKILCGLLFPAKGSVSMWNGTEYRTATTGQLNGRIGYLFQNPDAQIFLPTVFDELALGLRKPGLTRAQVRERVESTCEIFSLPDPQAPPALMSYGARRRLQAAICYLLDRQLLVLDEVDTGLSYRELSALLAALRSTGAGILLITHDLALATAASARILLMDNGRVRADLLPGDFHRLAALREESLQGTERDGR